MSDKPKIRLFDGIDAAVLVGLIPLWLIAWTLPESVWHRLGRKFSPVRDSTVARIREMAGDRDLGQPPDLVDEELSAGFFEESLQVIRHYRPGGWTPPIRLIGEEHVATALEQGRGAILWVAHTSFGSLVSKIALFRAGYKVSHLSHPRHGFSATHFGMAVLNKIQTHVETQYLRERVVMGLDSPRAALETLEERLADNEPVSVTVREQGRRPLEAPFLASKIPLAPGAPVLAHKTGAALLPVFTWRDPQGVFEVVVDPPLPVSRDLPREDALAACVDAYVAGVERLVLKAPGQWRGWRYM